MFGVQTLSIGDQPFCRLATIRLASDIKNAETNNIEEREYDLDLNLLI